MLILGMGVLGDLNTPATSQESLGLAFWRIVVSAGILAMVMSVINLVSVSGPYLFKAYEANADFVDYFRASFSQTAPLGSLHVMYGSTGR